MQKSLPLIAGIIVSAGFCLFLQINNAVDAQQPIRTGQPQSMSPMGMNTSTLSPQDQQFFTAAARGNLAEIQLGKLALTKSQNNQVKAIAQHMIQEHQNANQSLASIAQQYNLTMPTTIEQRHQALMTQLSQLSGRTFDHAFLNSQLTEHNMAISLYQRHIQTGKNASLKAYATNSLPVLESHRNQIRAALTQLDR